MAIALIAHDGKKADLVHFALNNKDAMQSTEVVATGTTGKLLLDAGIEVRRMRSGPEGGDAQIAALVVEGDLKAVFFFRDPMDKHPHEPDIQMLMRLCDVHNVPLATNPATAQLVLNALIAS